jgi:hypothetical protein
VVLLIYRFHRPEWRNFVFGGKADALHLIMHKHCDYMTAWSKFALQLLVFQVIRGKTIGSFLGEFGIDGHNESMVTHE